MNIKGYIKDYDGKTLTIVAPFSSSYFLEKQIVSQCSISLDDGRGLSDEQRIAICAICRDIGEWTGNFEAERYFQTLRFCEIYDCEYFSLSTTSPICADMTTARSFLTYLIEFCIEHSVPCSKNLLEHCESVGRYVYCCLLNKTCCICGKGGKGSNGIVQLHHCGATEEQGSSKVGMGRDRTEIIHEGLFVMPLCSGVNGHHEEVEHIGQRVFEQKHHIHGVRADREICRIYNLNPAKMED